MRRHLLVLPLLAVFLSGCIQLEILLKVAKDGSGKFYETVLFDTKLLKEMIGSLPKSAGQPLPWEVNEPQLKSEAVNKGKGVKYESAKPIVKGHWKGYRAIYSFSDVRKLQVDPNPGGKAPPSPGAPPEKDKGDPMRFRFKKGHTAKLTILTPREKDKRGGKKKLDPSDPSFEMMRGMLRDMSVKIEVEVDGKVTKSSATHRKGNRITLLSLDFNQLVSDRERLGEVLNAQTYQESAAAFNKVPGMKIETKKQVFVSFK